MNRLRARVAGWSRNREVLVVLAIIVVLAGMLVAIKMVNGSDARGDSAFYQQTTENIAYRGVAVSSVQAAILSVVDSPLLTMKADQIAKAPLAPPAQPEIPVLRWHGYVILYLLAPFARIVPTQVVLLTADALSFLGVVALAYLFLRRRLMPIVPAALFCLLVVSHPAWSDGLLVWQFYPDRLFLLGGFTLLYLASRERTPAWALIVTAVLSALVNERGALIGGFFLLAYAVLFRDTLTKKARDLRTIAGVAMIAYGIFMLKIVLSNFYYETFMPTSIGGAIASVQHAAPGQIATFFLVNAVFLLLGCFSWRNLVIAVIAMVPNVVGSVGGAEKVGWMTHYHTYYLPALIWAGVTGYERAYRLFVTDRKRLPAFSAAAAVLVLFLGSVDAYSAGGAGMSLANVSNTFVPKFLGQANEWLFTPGHWKYRPLAPVIDKAIPPGSVVTAPEVMMPYLYRDRTVQSFPIDLDHADYAVLSADRSSGKLVYSGAINFLGPEEQKKVNEVLVQRMERDGYDFAHPTFVPEIGVAIVARRR